MLTADHVRVRKKGDALTLVALSRKEREGAERLAAEYLTQARARVGASREALEEAWDDVGADDDVPPRVAAGIRKLVEDACTFDGDAGDGAYELRRALFTRAAAARRALSDGERFDREAFVRAEAEARALEVPDLEGRLFADLRRADRLAAAPTDDATTVLERYELGQAQAVLLRAVQVTCDVTSASPAAVRAFFRRLKFHKLLFLVERIPAGGFRVIVDGPFSMFESVTKYGLRLALLLPALRELEGWAMTATVRWGTERAPLSFHLRAPDGVAPTGGKRARPRRASVPDDLKELVEGIARAKSSWSASLAQELLDIPGFGVCVPDLVLQRGDGERVFVEVLGFWSRDAVWRRVELARAGLGAKIVFAVSAKLRVSEEVLRDEDDAALYVYKGKMSARALLERAERLSRA